MRPSQHKNRQRSRGRRQGSSSNRSYESNGPDVKVRGTAQHVAEKYLQLGRDAQASGDRVMSESYFQHAEHYLRIVAANQPQQQQQQHSSLDDDDNRQDDGDNDRQDAKTESRTPPPGSGPQPSLSEKSGRSRSGSGNGSEREAEDKADGWAGPQPSFLQKPAADGEAEDSKPKRPARAPRTRRAKPADEGGEQAGKDKAADADDAACVPVTPN